MQTILILTAGFGSGHNSAARSLRDALLQEGGDRIRVEVLDLYQVAYGRLYQFACRLYISAINKTPLLWNVCYQLLDRTRWFEATLSWQGALRKLLQQTLQAKQVSLVCCTYPGYSYLLADLRRAGTVQDFFHTTLVTDSISINSIWYRATADAFIVPNDETAEIMARAGVTADKLHAFGFPVPPVFATLAQQAPVTDPAAPGPRVLYMINSGKSIAPRLVAKLLDIDGLYLTVAVGRDEELRQRLLALTREKRERVTVMGWTDQIPQLLMNHHLVITKAGGATTQEAIAAACPLIFSQMVPGQEEGNWELIRRVGGGFYVPDYRDIPRLVAEIFQNHAERWRQCRTNLQRISRPDAALVSAKYLLDQITPA